MSEIFDKKNEVYFRKIENRYLKEISLLEENKIISTGGGTPCFQNNLNIINESPNSTSIYLKANIDTLVNRLKDTVNNLRYSLEKTQIDIEERIQKSVASVNDVNKQLKGTVNSLRDRVESKEAQRIEELQNAAKIKRDEHSQLEEIINTLREKLEVQNGNEN